LVLSLKCTVLSFRVMSKGNIMIYITDRPKPEFSTSGRNRIFGSIANTEYLVSAEYSVPIAEYYRIAAFIQKK
jgi:hypothetical protein